MKRFPITHYEYMYRRESAVLGGDFFEQITRTIGDVDISLPEYGMVMNDVGATLTTYLMEGEEALNMAMQMSYQSWRLWRHGEKIYHISRNLCNLLLNTKLTIDAEFIQAPFGTVYLDVDQDIIKMTDYTGTKAMKGIYVTIMRERDGVRRMRFLATSGVSGIEEHLDVNHFATFDLPEHGDVDYIIEHNFGNVWKRPDRRPIPNHRYLIDLNVMKDIFTFTVNVLVYLMSSSARTEIVNPDKLPDPKMRKSKKKKDRAERERAKYAQYPFIMVGGDIPKVNVIQGTGSKVTCQFDVASHWRMQWKGSRKDGTFRQVPTLVHSYTKGKDFAKRLSKQHVAELEDENEQC